MAENTLGRRVVRLYLPRGAGARVPGHCNDACLHASGACLRAQSGTAMQWVCGYHGQQPETGRAGRLTLARTNRLC